ncbi:MAG: hypothetical protein ABJL67_14405 [Sulfitobacter sp.]
MTKKTKHVCSHCYAGRGHGVDGNLHAANGAKCTGLAARTGIATIYIGRIGAEVFLYKLYVDHAASDPHLASDLFQAFDGATASMLRSKDVAFFTEVHQ